MSPAPNGGWPSSEAWALAQLSVGAPALSEELGRAAEAYQGEQLHREVYQEAMVFAMRQLWLELFGVDTPLRNSDLHTVADWYVITRSPGKLDLLHHGEVMALAEAVHGDDDQEELQ